MKINVAVCIWIAVGGFLSMLAVPCHAQSICPWLNTATASGVLGGAARVEVRNPGTGTASCVFQLQNGAPTDTLRIAVIRTEQPENAGKAIKSYEVSCTSSGTPLKGVGNEALLCVSNTKTSRGELVVGRVRDNIFTVAISVGSGDDSASTQNALAEKAESIAKQVAGSLF